jgi:hypothetical protein
MPIGLAVWSAPTSMASLRPRPNVGVRGFGNYGSSYELRFDARSGDTIRVWMYSPATPGYVVIDDVTLMLDQPVSITDGEWVITLTSGPFGRFT